MNFNISSFLTNAKRVLSLTKKPSADEYWAIAKVTALGIFVLGAIAYVISTIKFLLI